MPGRQATILGIIRYLPAGALSGGSFSPNGGDSHAPVATGNPGGITFSLAWLRPSIPVAFYRIERHGQGRVRQCQSHGRE